jgi:hypothetical protein
MVSAVIRRLRFPLAFAGLVLAAILSLRGGEPPSTEDAFAPSSAARLKYLQQVLRDMKVESTAEEDKRELEFQMTPLLRYNDIPRGIADSIIFRLGTRGRPIAIVTAELYGGKSRQFLLNHEFLAIDDPRVRIRRDVFEWQPPREAGVNFQPIETDKPPAGNARARLAQFKQLAGRFSAREEWRGEKMELRLLPTPIDRYVPTDKPNADAAIFAFVWGVNPEALLFLETDGTTSSFAWARLGAAQSQAKLDDRTVWEAPPATEHEHPTAGYTSIHRNALIPLELEKNDDESK